MHQNLKASFSLKQKDNEKKVKNNWQILRPDFQFGTFFVLYGKIRGQIEKDLFVPDECDLYVQNYQGNITIGLTSVEDIDIAFDATINEVVYILYVHVKALHANEFLKEIPLKIKHTPSIKEHPNYERFNVKKINTNYNIRVELIFDDLDKSIFDKNNLSKSVLIDDTKYVRDGDQLLEKKYSLLNNKEESLDHDFDNIRAVKGVFNTKKCYPTYVKMVL